MLNQNTPAFIAHPRHGGDFHIVRPPQYDSMIHTQPHNPHRLLYDTHRKIVRVRLLSFTPIRVIIIRRIHYGNLLNKLPPKQPAHPLRYSTTHKSIQRVAIASNLLRNTINKITDFGCLHFFTCAQKFIAPLPFPYTKKHNFFHVLSIMAT